MALSSVAEVFIVESNQLKDEQAGDREGFALAEILSLCGKKPQYRYIRTKRELFAILNQFSSSGYRYLHLACHGVSGGLALSLEDLSFRALARILAPHMRRRRLFVSACEGVCRELAFPLVKNAKCHSVVGPQRDILFSDSAVVWAAFYTLMFKIDDSSMRTIDIVETLKPLCRLFRVQFGVYFHEKSSESYSFLKVDAS